MDVRKGRTDNERTDGSRLNLPPMVRTLIVIRIRVVRCWCRGPFATWRLDRISYSRSKVLTHSRVYVSPCLCSPLWTSGGTWARPLADPTSVRVYHVAILVVLTGSSDRPSLSLPPRSGEPVGGNDG